MCFRCILCEEYKEFMLKNRIEGFIKVLEMVINGIVD